MLSRRVLGAARTYRPSLRHACSKDVPPHRIPRGQSQQLRRGQGGSRGQWCLAAVRRWAMLWTKRSVGPAARCTGCRQRRDPAWLAWAAEACGESNGQVGSQNLPKVRNLGKPPKVQGSSDLIRLIAIHVTTTSADRPITSPPFQYGPSATRWPGNYRVSPTARSLKCQLSDRILPPFRAHISHILTFSFRVVFYGSFQSLQWGDRHLHSFTIIRPPTLSMDQRIPDLTPRL